jgi:Ca2+-binding RTX toxin-like protein/LysM repeat protein
VSGSEDPNKDMVVGMDGAVFTNLGNGGWAISAPSGEIQVKNQNGSGSIFHSDGMESHFDASGQALSEAYTVASGDILSQIALDNGITLQELLDANHNIVDQNVIIAGEILTIPPSAVDQQTVDAAMLGQQSVVNATGNAVRTQTAMNADGSGPALAGSTSLLSIDQAAIRGANQGSAAPWVPLQKCPLVLDLDGDGIETMSMTDYQIRFDLSGDGFATQTGWVGADDGLLVIDNNGDGKINNINELFGDNSSLTPEELAQIVPGDPDSDNPYQYAPGFADLAAFDENGDGVVDLSDSGFSSILVWQDVNSNAVTEEGELVTLGSLGITGLNHGYQVANQNNNDNVVTGISTFNKSDGTTGELVDVYFAFDVTNSRYVEQVDLRIETLFMPKLRGYGLMADLHVAMSLDSSLLNMVQTISSLEFSEIDQMEMQLEEVLYRWAGAQGVEANSRGGDFDARKLAVIEAITAGPWSQSGVSNPNAYSIPYLNNAWNSICNGYLARLLVQTDAMPAEYGALYDINTDLVSMAVGDINALVSDLIANTPESLKEGIFYLKEKLPLLHVLAPGLNSTSTNFDTILASQLEGTLFAGVVPYIMNSTLTGTAGADILTIGDIGKTMLGMEGDDVITAGSGDDLLAGGTENDILNGGDGADLLLGNEGNDILDGGADLDELRGGEGDDILGGVYDSSDYSSSTSVGGAYRGNDYYGGVGNDTLRGTRYSDDYYFNAGDGQDLIQDNSAYNQDRIILGAGITAADLQISYDGPDLIINFINTSDQIRVENWYVDIDYQIESLSFADGNVWSQNTLNYLGLSQYGTDLADTMVGNDSGNRMYGLAGNDTLDGGSGLDILKGGEGDDILGGVYGSSDYSSSTFVGGAYRGNDYYGGVGNDTLRGTRYSDNYYFNAGDGQDFIQDNSSSSTNYNQDRIILGAGISAADLQLTNDGSNLIINFVNTSDQIQVENWYVDNDYQIESLSFADGNVWSQYTLDYLGLSQYGTDLADTMVGDDNRNRMYGLAGNDTLDGGSGLDILKGGDGDDILGGVYGSSDYYSYTTISGIRRGNDYYGGIGNDTINGTYYSDHYYYNAGDGQDMITDYYGSSTNYTERNTDRLILGSGITAADLQLTNDGSNLIINFSNGTDQIKVMDWYGNWKNRLEELEFYDGTVWDQNTIHAKGYSHYGTEDSDVLTGDSGFNTFHGLAGDDVLGVCLMYHV